MADASTSPNNTSGSLFAVSLLVAVLAVVFYLSNVSATSWSLVSLTVAVVVCRLLRGTRRRDGDTDRRVCALVLGDVGRSPRMQYHCLSLSTHGYHVTFVGFAGTKPHQDLLQEEKISIFHIKEVNGIRGNFEGSVATCNYLQPLSPMSAARSCIGVDWP